MQGDGVALRRDLPGQRTGDLAQARAPAPGQPQHLAAPHAQVHTGGRAGDAQVAYLQGDVGRGLRAGRGGRDVVGGGAGHRDPHRRRGRGRPGQGAVQGRHHQPGRVELGRRGVQGDPAVPQHEHPVDHLEHLRQPVADVEHAAALAAQPAGDRVQALDLGGGERRRDLVHHDQLGVLGEHPGGLDQAVHEARDVGHECVGVQVQPDLGQHRPGAGTDPGLGCVGQRGAAQDRPGHGQPGVDPDELLDHPDPEVPGVLGRQGRIGVALHGHPPGVRGVDARDDVAQRRLAGAVGADQPDDLAGVDAEGHVAQHPPTLEGLRETVHLQHGHQCSGLPCRAAPEGSRRRPRDGEWSDGDYPRTAGAPPGIRPPATPRHRPAGRPRRARR
ncbi:unannotated protein [freshwater metagenome]|uniref:Unannotated protein n=1 Tax=freshwater metagenome TaxID=449393 RepID=A0A6J7GNZ1_9ZZZZ